MVLRKQEEEKIQEARRASQILLPKSSLEGRSQWNMAAERWPSVCTLILGPPNIRAKSLG